MQIFHYIRGSKSPTRMVSDMYAMSSCIFNLCDLRREVACSASDRQGSNFELCVWRTVSSQSSHHPKEVLQAQFSLYVHKGGLKPDSFHFISFVSRGNIKGPKKKSFYWGSFIRGKSENEELNMLRRLLILLRQ